jgi:hypothetical protein
MSDRKVRVALKYVSQALIKASDYKDGPSLTNGPDMKGAGWYWALIKDDGTTDDEWWFGPESTKEMARFVAEQDGYKVVRA